MLYVLLVSLLGFSLHGTSLLVAHLGIYVCGARTSWTAPLATSSRNAVRIEGHRRTILHSDKPIVLNADGGGFVALSAVVDIPL
ncbi:hypothetical protein P152DRAFT_455038 [Eremomyces bilateralis CBS 781.70]|uniref:Uncharacterized protein n=1 Tax=Eremomyces bilateralis CBS 781.70 TaxID=1392243 RepID=A0A6G1GBP2_9PEZI|nr:uncharacterized protein P152DRAFT_455038 [Eremomyces bilateralis CBS 781.70]KAF1815320.1 hypothetical protein P152DRAFT_455038 [Eremomyces bilateralis CBS 781.70]